MRTITINNEKLNKLLSEKETLILEGRATSELIETKESELQDIDKQVQEIEKTVDIKDLEAEATKATEAFNQAVKQMEDVRSEIFSRMSKAVPNELKEKYETTKKEIEELEIKRNKIALNAQKRTDKIIPLARKEMAKFLKDEFEDFESLKLENGIIVGTIFNQVEEFKQNYLNRKK